VAERGLLRRQAWRGGPGQGAARRAGGEREPRLLRIPRAHANPLVGGERRRHPPADAGGRCRQRGGGCAASAGRDDAGGRGAAAQRPQLTVDLQQDDAAMSVEVRIPQIGFSTQEGTLTEWLVADGGRVEAGKPLYTLELDKSVQEIESPA